MVGMWESNNINFSSLYTTCNCEDNSLLDM